MHKYNSMKSLVHENGNAPLDMTSTHCSVMIKGLWTSGRRITQLGDPAFAVQTRRIEQNENKL